MIKFLESTKKQSIYEFNYYIDGFGADSIRWIVEKNLQQIKMHQQQLILKMWQKMKFQKLMRI